ncbi:MAG TPA: hypothetical protein VG276_17080 [Actinomycetes bacterium]|jgi:hypothetical protein|nr:hypothetical protein [Actinomycetes bacterium]
MGWRAVGWRTAVAAVVAAGTVGTAPAAEVAPRTSNTRLVGHLDPGPGPYADVWVHAGIAYLGGYRNKACATAPNGVSAIDVRDPARPRLLAQFGKFPGSDDQDVWVGRVQTPSFSGDLAVTGIQSCGGQAAKPRFVGLALFDVTDPARPKPLGRLATGARAGVHELGVAVRPDGRVLALAAVPGSFPLSRGEEGDLRIIEVTDPRRPKEIADWDVRRDGPAELRSKLATRPDVFCHSAWPFDHGNKLFASFWAAGELFLDIADPAKPRLVGRTSYQPSDRHQAAHSGWFNRDETLFVQNDEALGVDEGPGASWPSQRIWDTRTLSEPKLVGTFATEAAAPGRDGRIGLDGFYSVHNAVVEGELEYVSWYSDGVRVVDLSDPAHPREVGSFVPPPEPAPGSMPADSPDGRRTYPLVWGVHQAQGLVFASDMASGLWVFQFTGSTAGAGGGNGARAGDGAAAPRDGGPVLDASREPGPSGVVLGAGALAGLLAAGAAAAAVRRARQRASAREAPPGG